MLFHCISPDSFSFHTYTIQSQSQFNLNKIYFSFLFLHKINYLRLNQLFSHIYPRTKKSRLFSKSLENKRLRPLCYFIELLVIFDEIWTTDFCVSELHPHNHLYVYTTGNCLFLVFSFTLRKQDMSLKVPKFKKFQVFFLWSIVTVSTWHGIFVETHIFCLVFFKRTHIIIIQQVIDYRSFLSSSLLSTQPFLEDSYIGLWHMVCFYHPYPLVQMSAYTECFSSSHLSSLLPISLYLSS